MKRLIALFAFLSAILASSYCYADVGGVRGEYKYGDELISGVEVDLYKIADYDETGFHYAAPYIGHEVDIGSLTNSELGDYGQELATIGNTPSATTETVNGSYSFYDMEEGIWLVKFKDIKIGDYTYTALPIVLTMPDRNLNYDIELITKLEKSCPDCVEPDPDIPPEEENVNTYDAIKKYIGVLCICIIVEVLMLHVIIKDKKKKGNNEKN